MQAEAILPYTNNCSPLFIIGTVGVSILSGRKIGYVLYLVHIVSAIIYAIISRNKIPVSITAQENSDNKIHNPFITSVRESSMALISITVYIVFFSVICELISAFSPFKNDIWTALICGFLEISTGIIMISITNISAPLKLAIVSAIISLSGLCITLQTADIMSDLDISIKNYIFGKLKIAIISFILTYIIFSIFPPLVNVFNDCSQAIKNNTAYVFWSAFIPAMIILFFYTKN